MSQTAGQDGYGRSAVRVGVSLATDRSMRGKMRRVSLKRQRRMKEAKPVRDELISRVGCCEICGASPSRPRRGVPLDLSQLCCHEIANGPLREKALDQPYALLVLCWYCNGHEVVDKSEWPEARQLAVLAESRPEDFDLEAFCYLMNPRAPNRVTLDEVIEHGTSKNKRAGSDGIAVAGRSRVITEGQSQDRVELDRQSATAGD